MALFTRKFESAKQDWTTPQAMFDRLHSEFKFTVDLAADNLNTKCLKFYSSDNSALSVPWVGTGWLNPPYGDKAGKLSEWVKKAYAETRKEGCCVVMLIPARTNTRWFHDYCMKAEELRFFKGRPKFGEAKHGLPQPLVLVVFRAAGKLWRPPKLSSFEVQRGE
jgi:phage N-6-adenine-methyltransferase